MTRPWIRHWREAIVLWSPRFSIHLLRRPTAQHPAASVSAYTSDVTSGHERFCRSAHRCLLQWFDKTSLICIDGSDQGRSPVSLTLTRDIRAPERDNMKDYAEAVARRVRSDSDRGQIRQEKINRP